MGRFNSIRARMTLGFVLALAPFLLITCTILALVNSRVDEAHVRYLLRHTAFQARRLLGTPHWQDGLTHLMDDPPVREYGIGLLILDGQRRVLWRSSAELPTRPPPAGGDWQVVARRRGGETILALHPDRGWTARRDTLLSEMLVLCLCVLLAVAAGAWAMVGRTLRPIHEISRQADRAAADSLDARLTAPSQDAEVTELVGTLNGLLTRQALTAAAKGRFYAAASHELRTPLQALSGHLELALSRPRAAGEYLSALQEAQGQTQRLISLVRALLLLHQLEGPSRQPQEPTDLAAICRGALALVRPLLDERGLRLNAELPDQGTVCAVPTHAEILTRNLLENAARYARAGGRVGVTLTEAEGAVRLEIVNDCALSEAEDPQAWLDPFRRPDAARTAKTGGNGLGLAICRALADANGWQFGLRRGAEDIRATVTFQPGDFRSFPTPSGSA